jgi:opacity protein-like surface antigen
LARALHKANQIRAMKQLIFILGIIFTFSLNISAQCIDKRQRVQDKNKRPSISFGMQLADPMENLEAAYRSAYIGMEGAVMINVRQTPFEVGASFAWAYLGSQQRNIALVVGEVDGQNIHSNGSKKFSHDNYRGYLVGRFKPFTGRIQPYADFLLGAQGFTSTAVTQRTNSGYTEIVAKEKLERSISPSFGYGFGLKLRLNRYVLVETKYQYLHGQFASFTNPTTTHISSNGDLHYETATGSTTMQVFHVGMSFEF